jgi:CheY-like chemotaxis protein/MinD-like ATPase involved in chromosome partitioning or flagellar assembly
MGAKILVVDDDLEGLKLVGMILQAKGYQIVAAQNGAQALAKAVSEAPDLMILDVMMPDMDGYEVCRRLRADPRTATLPVVMFTAKTQVEDKVTGFESGADEYLTKPIHPAELISRVEALLARSARLGGPASLQRTAKVFGFLGCKGGVGISSLITNVGVILAREVVPGKKVFLLDLQPGRATIGPQMDVKLRGGLQSLLALPANGITAETLFSQTERHSTGVVVLPGPLVPLGMLPLTPAHVETILRLAAANSDFVLVDLGSELGPANQAALQQMDHLFVVFEPQRISLMLAQAMLTSLEEIGFGRHRIGLAVLNRAPAAVTLGRDAMENLLQHPIDVILPPAPEVAFQAAERGMPMVMIQAGGVYAEQVRQLARLLVTL